MTPCYKWGDGLVIVMVTLRGCFRPCIRVRRNVVIENRAGANSNIGAELVAHASADGYTALYNTSSIVFNMYIYPKLGYDTFRDFAPVTLTAVVPQVLVVIPALPVRTLQDFITQVRTQPGKLNYASVGYGNNIVILLIG